MTADVSTTKPLAAYSQFRVANGLVFTAGHVGLDDQGVAPKLVADEVRLAIAHLAATLEDAGSDLSRLLQVHCVLTDMADFDAFDAAYREIIPAPFPPRMTQGGALFPGASFEVIAVAEVSAEAEIES